MKGDGKLYHKQGYVIIRMRDGFIAYNTAKEWEDGHTHLKGYKAAKTAIDLVLRKKMPRSTGFYFLKSLVRLSNDPEYQRQIENLIGVRKGKGKKGNYYNTTGRRKGQCT